MGGAATITTVDALVDNSVQQNGFSLNAEDISGALTFDGSNEADGYFRIQGSDQADTITGGAKDDFIYADETDTINGGNNNTVDRLSNANGDTVIFTAAVDSANLDDNDLQNIETISVVDIGADGSEVYDFSVQSEDLFIVVTAQGAYTGVTLKGGDGADTMMLGDATDTITASVKTSIDTLISYEVASTNGDVIDVTTAAIVANVGQTDKVVELGDVDGASYTINDGVIYFIDEDVATGGDDTIIVIDNNDLANVIAAIEDIASDESLIVYFDDTTNGTTGSVDSTLVVSEHSGGTEAVILVGVAGNTLVTSQADDAILIA